MKMPFKTLWSEFKAFAFKGNMIDLAVAVVIGAAFGKVINALVDDVIMPSVSYVVTGASAAAKTAGDIAQVATNKVGLTTQPATTQSSDTQPSDTQPATLPVVVTFAPPPAPVPAVAPAPTPAAKPADKPPEQAVDVPWKIGRIKIGDFIGALINFMIIAFAVFMVIVKLLGTVMKRVGGTPKPSEPTTRECPECLSLIPLKARRCSHCTAVVAPAALPPLPPSDDRKGN